jgi:hypothetical protein
MNEKHQEDHQGKWEIPTSTMEKCKLSFEKNTNTKTMNRREQVVVSRLRTGYTRTTYASSYEQRSQHWMSFLRGEDNDSHGQKNKKSTRFMILNEKPNC